MHAFIELIGVSTGICIDSLAYLSAFPKDDNRPLCRLRATFD